MHTDLDQYYTPISIAKDMLLFSNLIKPSVCVDSTCGRGNLLTAVTSIYQDIKCVGIDRDQKSIDYLRKQHPDWSLSVADLLHSRSINQASVVSGDLDTDFLFLNPPFSLGNKNYVKIDYQGKTLKVSVAMGHILQSFKLFSPSQGAIVFAPESVLYSETDSEARYEISKSHAITKITELVNTTFKGARVNTVVIRISPEILKINKHNKIINTVFNQNLNIKVCRGGLPVHIFSNVKNDGVPYIHSTNLKKISTDNPEDSLGFTNIKRKGRVSKWMLLIPRVGLVNKEYATAVYFSDTIQLSDCVIALLCNSEQEVKILENRIKDNWNGFKDLYRGTAARYITLSRLTSWLKEQNITVISD